MLHRGRRMVNACSMLLDLMEANVELNLPDKARRNVHVGELNWGDRLPEKIPVQDVSVILAADCVYFEVSNRPCARARGPTMLI